MTRFLILVGLCGIGLLIATSMSSRLSRLPEDQPQKREDAKQTTNSEIVRTLPIVAATALVTAAPPWAVDAKDFSLELQQKAYAATLRVKSPTDDIGTAVRVRRAPSGRTYYLTAAHVVKDCTTVNLDWFDPKTGNVAGTVQEARVKEVWPTEDLALLIADDVNETEVLPLCPAGKSAVAPFPALSVGCPKGAPDLWLDDARKKAMITQKDENKPDDKGISVMFWQVTQDSLAGRSGGPLIDKNGNLVGICKGKVKDNSYYLHSDEVHKCLKNKRWDRFLAPEAQEPAKK